MSGWRSSILVALEDPPDGLLDFYIEAHILAGQLTDAGLDDWAVAVKEVVAGGANATEILPSEMLTGLLGNLQRLLQAEGQGLDAGLRRSVSEWAGAISVVLD